MSINKEGKIDKGWGYELIFASNDLYCGKEPTFTKNICVFFKSVHLTTLPPQHYSTFTYPNIGDKLKPKIN